MMRFDEAVRARHAVRGFHPEPLDPVIIDEILAEAALTPSNCNTQPWHVHVVSGSILGHLSEALIGASDVGARSADFSWDMEAFDGDLARRKDAQGAAYRRALGVERDDAAGRRRARNLNFEFFGGPHVALLFFRPIGDSVRVAADMGMYAQTLLLSLAARGLGGIPQTALGLYADVVREVLGIDDSLKLLFGISFGRIDPAAPANSYRLGRDAAATQTTFHQ